jgi:hypothetical protein
MVGNDSRPVWQSDHEAMKHLIAPALLGLAVLSIVGWVLYVMLSE